MPDISMCKNRECPMNGTCYRYTATPNPYKQAYADFEFQTENGVTSCKYYWPNE